MSLFTGITQREKLGGIFGLSCYLPLSEKLSTFMPDGFPNRQTPVFMAHGDSDPTVLYEWGQRSADHIKGLGMTVEFNKYPYDFAPSPVTYVLATEYRFLDSRRR